VGEERRERGGKEGEGEGKQGRGEGRREKKRGGEEMGGERGALCVDVLSRHHHQAIGLEIVLRLGGSVEVDELHGSILAVAAEELNHILTGE
jgi:hypothetical protein